VSERNWKTVISVIAFLPGAVLLAGAVMIHMPVLFWGAVFLLAFAAFRVRGMWTPKREKSRTPFVEYSLWIQKWLKCSYDVNVVFCDIPARAVGDLDGKNIYVSPYTSSELRLFLLAHLFGHTVQWNTKPEYFPRDTVAPILEENEIEKVLCFERKAARYGLELLHEVGIDESDQWFSDYSAMDQAYLASFYRTGVKHDPKSFWKENTPLIRSLSIPDFTPRVRKEKKEGVVI
jgi:hypothetical protein